MNQWEEESQAIKVEFTFLHVAQQHILCIDMDARSQTHHVKLVTRLQIQEIGRIFFGQILPERQQIHLNLTNCGIKALHMGTKRRERSYEASARKSKH